MSYYTRAFCKSTEVPSIKNVIDYVKERGIDLTIINNDDLDVDSKDWSQVELQYSDGKLPLVVNLDASFNEGNDIFIDDIKMFKEKIGKPGLSLTKIAILNGLSTSKYLITIQILSDIDAKGSDAAWSILFFFEQNYKGLIHIEDEGFYKDNKLVFKI